MKEKKKKNQEVPVECAVPFEPTRWAESFDDPDHRHFIRMSAEAMQEAMNIAADQRDVEKMLAVAGHWGTLAATLRDLTKSKTTIGFNKEESGA